MLLTECLFGFHCVAEGKESKPPVVQRSGEPFHHGDVILKELPIHVLAALATPVFLACGNERLVVVPLLLDKIGSNPICCRIRCRGVSSVPRPIFL